MSVTIQNLSKSLSNQPCMARPTLIVSNPDQYNKDCITIHLRLI